MKSIINNSNTEPHIMDKQTQTTRNNPLAEDARRAPVGPHLHRSAVACLAVLWLFFGAARVLAQTYALGATNLVEGPAAGADSVALAVSSPVGPWTATANDSWLHPDAANGSGTGSTNVVFTFDANPGATRAGTLLVAGQTVTITQAGSTYIAANLVATLASSGVGTPWGVAVDGAGNAFFSDTTSHAIKRWTVADGTVATLVATGLTKPESIAMDSAGNLYIADVSDHTIKKWTSASQQLSTLVSSGLAFPAGVAVDGAGNVYFSDSTTNTISKWTVADGTVSNLVSSGLKFPAGVAVDGAGNVYFADSGHNAIKKWMAASGTVITLISSGLSNPTAVALDGAGDLYVASGGAIKKWSAANNTVATLVASGLNQPDGMAVDGAGNVYIAEWGNRAIRELARAFVDPTARTETTDAGTDLLPAVVPATANLSGPFAPTSDQSWLTISGVGNGVVSFAFTANPSVSRLAHLTLLGTNIAIAQAGSITANLGTNALTEQGAAGSDSVALAVSPTGPWAATANAAWLHLDAANQSGTGSASVVFTFDANAGTPRAGTLTIAGQMLTVTQLGLNALGTTNLLEGPAAGADSVVLAVKSSTQPWMATANDSWLHLDATNQSGTGSATVAFTLDANPGATRTGTLSVGGVTLSVTQAGSTYIAANPVATLVAAPVSPATALLWGLTVDGAGNVYFTDSVRTPAGTYVGVIKKWFAANGQVTTLISSPELMYLRGVALDGAGNVYFADSLQAYLYKWTVADGTLAVLDGNSSDPRGVALDGAGNVYWSDAVDLVIYKWTAASQQVTTLISSGLNGPRGVAVDSAGNVYIADLSANAIKKWTAATGTLASLPIQGLNQPTGVAVDGAGNVYFSDSFNHLLKKWSAANGAITTLPASGLINPIGVALDASGNLFFADLGTALIGEMAQALVEPSPRAETGDAGSDMLPAVLPATESLLPPFAPASDQAWLTISGVANGVVSYSSTANTTLATRTAHLTVLGQSIPITQAGAPLAPTLSGPTLLPGGSFQFSFSGTPGATYSVLFTTNLALPLSAWKVVGPATVSAPGQFQFTATPSTATPKGFYRVGSP